MTTHKDEHEKNELILRQRQEIARLTMELARIERIAFGGSGIDDEPMTATMIKARNKEHSAKLKNSKE